MVRARRPHHNLSTGKLLLIITTVLLVILGSIVLVYTTVTNQVAADHAHGTATAQTNATRFAQAVTKTAVGELQLSETAQVSAMMTAEANATATAVAQVHPTATAQAFANATATAQAIADQNPYPPYGGVLALSDPLSSNSQGHDWEVYSRPAMNNCQFVGGAYESTVSFVYIVGSNICIAKSTNLTNFAYQVQMTLLKGSCGGISFRGNTNIRFLNEFHVCSNGTYEFYSTSGGILGSPLAYGPSPALHKGIGQTYILAVVAIGNTLTVYANGQKIATVNQSYNPYGQIGCESTSIGGVLTVAIFRNAKVWVF
jgi:eukaryotic-like serine/threonine-protein kinase